jgi:hypothetical protein
MIKPYEPFNLGTQVRGSEVANEIDLTHPEAVAVSQAAEQTRSMRAQAEVDYFKKFQVEAPVAARTRWTFSSVRVLDANGALKNQGTGSFLEGTDNPHAEEEALKGIKPETLAATDTVIIYTDQFACWENCVPLIKKFTKETKANVRVFSSAVRTTESLPGGGTRDVASRMKSVATGQTTEGIEIIEDLLLQRVRPMPPTAGPPTTASSGGTAVKEFIPKDRAVIGPELEPPVSPELELAGGLMAIAAGMLLNLPLQPQYKNEDQKKYQDVAPEIQRRLEVLRPEIQKLAAASPEATVWANITLKIEREPPDLLQSIVSQLGGPTPPPLGELRSVAFDEAKISTSEVSRQSTGYSSGLMGLPTSVTTSYITYSIPVGGVAHESLTRQLTSKVTKFMHDLPRILADELSGREARATPTGVVTKVGPTEHVVAIPAGEEPATPAWRDFFQVYGRSAGPLTETQPAQKASPPAQPTVPDKVQEPATPAWRELFQVYGRSPGPLTETQPAQKASPPAQPTVPDQMHRPAALHHGQQAAANRVAQQAQQAATNLAAQQVQQQQLRQVQHQASHPAHNKLPHQVHRPAALHQFHQAINQAAQQLQQQLAAPPAHIKLSHQVHQRIHQGAVPHVHKGTSHQFAAQLWQQLLNPQQAKTDLATQQWQQVWQLQQQAAPPAHTVHKAHHRVHQGAPHHGHKAATDQATYQMTQQQIQQVMQRAANPQIASQPNNNFNQAMQMQIVATTRPPGFR